MTRVEICLGSSCFARGGARFPAAVAGWLRSCGRSAEVRGRRCSTVCADGPTVFIDGVPHQVANEQALFGLLERSVQTMSDPAARDACACMPGSADQSAVPISSRQP